MSMETVKRIRKWAHCHKLEELLNATHPWPKTPEQVCNWEWKVNWVYQWLYNVIWNDIDPEWCPSEISSMFCFHQRPLYLCQESNQNAKAYYLLYEQHALLAFSSYKALLAKAKRRVPSADKARASSYCAATWKKNWNGERKDFKIYFWLCHLHFPG